MNKNILIDCGSNLGQGFLSLKNKLNINESWKIILFEPNPVCYNHLISTLTDSNIEINQKAVFHKNGEMKFFIPNNDHVSQGSTLYKEIHNSITPGVYNDSIEIIIPTIDLSEFITSLGVNNNIYLKLDIEGAEYDVLEHMIKLDTVKHINKLYVEFHDQYASPELILQHDLKNRKDNIINYLISNNIDFQLWH